VAAVKASAARPGASATRLPRWRRRPQGLTVWLYRLIQAVALAPLERAPVRGPVHQPSP